MNAPRIDWHARRQELRIDGRAVIGGLRVPSIDGQTFDGLSPIDGSLLTTVARGGAADIDAAVRSARAAFADGCWARKPPAARKKVLQRFAENILAAREELALLETLDMGKPVQHSLAVDVAAAARCSFSLPSSVNSRPGPVSPMNAFRIGARRAPGIGSSRPSGSG